MRETTLGIIIGHRDVLPASHAQEGRSQLLEVLRKQGIGSVILPEDATPYGAVGSLSDAKICADFFRANKDKIDGIIITLPNFGDERSISDALKLADLDCPVFVHAWSDTNSAMGLWERRDSFCGKFSVCNNLYQRGIKFSLGKLHTVSPTSPEFSEEVSWFAGVCRVVKGLRNARIGQVGGRTTPFKTVRYSEKILERAGISVETIDFSEIMLEMEKLGDSDQGVQSRLRGITDYISVEGVPAQSLLTMAKLATALDAWVESNELDAVAIRCWRGMQFAVGIIPCTVMGMMNTALLPAACETDVMGAVSMLALQLASQTPSMLFDWNNNYENEPDKLMFYHCSAVPVQYLEDPKMRFNARIAKFAGEANCYGTCVGRVKSGPFTFARASTDDVFGSIKVCVGHGEITDDPLDTFGTFGIARIPGLQGLLRWLCTNGFEHHVAASMCRVGDVLVEALGNYMEWDVHRHGDE